MSIESQIEREEAAIEEAVERGDMTRAEANKEYRNLQRDYADAAEMAGQKAYEEELARW